MPGSDGQPVAPGSPHLWCFPPSAPGGDSRSPQTARSKLAVPMPAPGFHAERGGGQAPASSAPRAGPRPPRPLTPASPTRDDDGAGSRSESTGDQSGPLGGPLSPVRCSSRPERPHLPPSLKTRSADTGFSFRSLARRSRTAPRVLEGRRGPADGVTLPGALPPSACVRAHFQDGGDGSRVWCPRPLGLEALAAAVPAR